MSDARRIKELLRGRVEELASYLFPNGRREGGHWCIGDIAGSPGGSFKICLTGDKAGLWGDFADSEKHSRSLLDLWMQSRNVDFKTALHEAAQWTGESLNGSNGLAGKLETFSWNACVAALTQNHLERLAKLRGYTPAFCSWLCDRELIGLHEECIAFPVHNEAGNVVAAHYRIKDGSWRYHPAGTKTSPFVIGKLTTGDPVHVFESQWDAFAFMDMSGECSGIVITRGAANGALVSSVIPENATLYLWTQNDAPGEKWQGDISATAGALVKRAKIPVTYKDLNEWTRAGASAPDLLSTLKNAEIISTATENSRSLIQFMTPLQLKNFVPPPGLVLVGDCHIVRGSVFVIGGPPGVGKSRASVALAEAGATSREWFGLEVHRRFKTMIIQTENGLFRLSKEFSELDCDSLDHYVRICPPPPFGLCLDREDFRAQLSAEIAQFQPDVIIWDPWNAVARDEKAREYLVTFEHIRSVLPTGDKAPAIGIVAHTRKPRPDERATGRGVLNLLAGSYVLGSVPRTAFIMQAASDDTEDNKVVWTCCKNNDGELGARSAWERRNGLFAWVEDFDWETFDNPGGDERITITEEHMNAVFENGQKQLTKSEAVKALKEKAKAKRTACYTALRSDGRFGKRLRETQGLIAWE